ncbi:ankyrin repeat domain-containing protein [Paractinoplanes hotanensis]|uniref:Ankyrin repeat domain-containing protein n=1 Tax=Paractinoplanes hotanensis TaxID=2906497 RepID=A0ABT0YCU7_9ACTN|nr:ankyrin repeat domain-containing protein [Actinoplanes hotanensis]MCM4083864.1 ankyrin repeat domain-containing protein [Actinoplanes hotanensis]
MTAKGDHSDIFEAARLGDVRAVQDHLGAGADMSAVDPYGFTALHSAAIGADATPVAQNLAVLDLLVRAGSSLEQRSGDGRTALFLAAEFASSTDAVQLLLNAGAQADIATDNGLHVLDNARAPAVAQLLSRVTGRPVPRQATPEPDPVRMQARQWHAASARIAAVFETLTGAGVVALQNIGSSQEDGFAECARAYRSHGGAAAGLHGFCYYTRQDTKRAKRTGRLPLAFWGAPEGAPGDMKRVGELVVGAFRDHGFDVDWNGSGDTRPLADLRAS